MNTPILNKESLVSGLTQKVPLKRLANVQEIVNVALFLASEDSSYVNGTTLVADGGMTGYSPTGFMDLIAEMMKKKKEVDNSLRFWEDITFPGGDGKSSPNFADRRRLHEEDEQEHLC